MKPLLSGMPRTPSSSAANDSVTAEEDPAVVESTTDSTMYSDLPKGRARRRSSQSRTSYQLAHPPPSARHRQRFRLRPKTLLQLQEVSAASRPIPILDVLPSILFAPRLAWRVPRILQNKHGMGLDDLVIVNSHRQTSAPTTPEGSPRQVDEDGPTDREIIAAICQSNPTENNGQCRTEIRFAHDYSWTATALRSGAYEFVSHSPGGTRSIARWVPKRENRSAEGAGKLDLPDPRFRFSLIDARSRRHPVIANMSRHSIDIYDRYSLPLSPRTFPHQGNPESFGPPSPCMEIGKIEDVERDEVCKTMVETDNQLRTMITVTGIWVAFCEQWSPNFRYSTKQVISNGVSELSNRRRSDGSQPLLLSRKDVLYRPSEIHTPSLSTIPPSPPSSPQGVFPQRTASTSTTVYGDRDSQYGARLESVHSVNPKVVGGLEPEFPISPIEDLSNGAKSEPTFLRDSEGCMRPVEKSPPRRVIPTEEAEQPLGDVAVIAEGRIKRPGKFMRVLGRLKRTSPH
ncbi:MAG: hypothetical protein L6R40_005164 [Gallowayella cf. fulva]|nr:MAG: hypothetical protein L6R40_005164 [Xanthomendoza cf. fulva]